MELLLLGFGVPPVSLCCVGLNKEQNQMEITSDPFILVTREAITASGVVSVCFYQRLPLTDLNLVPCLVSFELPLTP